MCINTRTGMVDRNTNMAYACQWPCVSEAAPFSATVQSAAMVPHASVPITKTVPSHSAQQLSFATALSGTKEIDDRPFPSPCIKGDPLSIKICQEEYQMGVEDCRKVLRACLTLNKGDKPFSARDLSAKIGKIWKTTAGWKMVPLGKGFYDFHFESMEDLKKIWAAGTVNLKPGLLRFSQWTKDFKLLVQKQTHVSLWIRLVELPQEYWRERTLKEIASVVGTPIDIDGPTRNRLFGHYARILVDIDLSKKAYDEVLVERDGFAFMVEIQYERRPLFCHHCYSIGHNITTCRWLNPQAAKEKVDRGKQPVIENVGALPKSRQHFGGGASTSALGGTESWIPVNSTVTTTTRTTVPASQTTQVTSVSNPVNNITQSIPFSLPTIPVSDLSSNSFSLPLHNVFDRIDRTSTDELDISRPVLEKVVSPVEHDDVQPVEAVRSHQTSREVLENPTMTAPRELVESPNGFIEHVTHSSPLGREDIRPDGVEQTTQTLREELAIPTVDEVSEPLQDGVELDHVSPQELVESPKGARESVARPSPIEHDDMHEVSTDFQDHHDAPLIEPPIVTIENSDGSLEGTNDVLAGLKALKIPMVTEASSVVDGGMPLAKDQNVVILQRQEVHPSKNIQHGLDLWERVRDYDARSAAEAAAGFMPVLTQNQKQKLKVQYVLSKQPSKSRARGDTQP